MLEKGLVGERKVKIFNFYLYVIIMRIFFICDNYISVVFYIFMIIYKKMMYFYFLGYVIFIIFFFLGSIRICIDMKVKLN